MSPQENKKVTLKGQAAIDLWQKGKEEWNKYVAANPLSDIYFSGVDFAEFELVSLESYNFPNGNVYFNHAEFGDGHVSFEKAEFGDGTVSFEKAKFGDGTVNFRSAKFGNGDVSFRDTEFGDGDVFFSKAKFGDGAVFFSNASFGDGLVYFFSVKFGNGNVNFSDADFGYGDVIFTGAEFGDGNVSFKGTKFGDGGVIFYHAKFGDGYVGFSGAKFGNGNVNFMNAAFGDGRVSFAFAVFDDGNVVFGNAKFGDGSVDFRNTKFGDGSVNFRNAEFGDGDVDFRRSEFGDGFVIFVSAEFGDGDVNFHQVNFGSGIVFFGHVKTNGSFLVNHLINSGSIEQFIFKFSTFNGPVNIEGNEFNCIPDFTNTKLANQLSLQDIQVKPNKKTFSNLLTPVFIISYKALWGQSLEYSYKKKAIRAARKLSIFNKMKIKDQNDIARIRRLKELAESNKHHKLALDLHVEEIKSSRWIETTSKRTLFAEYLFQIFGDFGRSLQRPFLALISTWAAFTPVYFYASDICDKLLNKLSDSAVFSFAQMLPLAPISRDAKKETLKSLYNDDMPNWIIGIAGFQSLISVALVFLIGLALRNRFRI